MTQTQNQTYGERPATGAFKFDVPSHEVRIKRYDGKAWRLLNYYLKWMPSKGAYRLIRKDPVKRGHNSWMEDVTLADLPVSTLEEAQACAIAYIALGGDDG